MATFKGYLIKAVKNGKKFPNKYIQMDSWDADPKQIEYIKAERDDNTRDMIKVAASGRKSTFRFSSKAGLTLADREVIKSFFTDNQINDEGDIKLEYWDDKNLKYREGTFYQPNMNFKIKKITDDDVIYNSLNFEFIEM